MLYLSTLWIAASASLPLPMPLTQDHMRDISCVAVMAIIASEQKRGDIRYGYYPAAGMAGRKWAGIVGERVTTQSGGSAERVAFAMHKAAQDEQAALISSPNAATTMEARYTACAPLMLADIDADLASAPLPFPQNQRDK